VGLVLVQCHEVVLELLQRGEHGAFVARRRLRLPLCAFPGMKRQLRRLERFLRVARVLACALRSPGHPINAQGVEVRRSVRLLSWALHRPRRGERGATAGRTAYPE